MNEKMKKALQGMLRPDETVLWESGTRPFRILDGREGRQTLLQWIFGTACVGALLAVYVAHGGKGLGFFAVLLVLLGIFVLAPLLQYRQTSGQRYFITNDRALVIQRGGSAYTMELADMDACRLYPLDFGGEAIALGSVLLEEQDRQLRWRASHPKENAEAQSTNEARGLVFYNVERAEAAMRLLRDDTAKEV